MQRYLIKYGFGSIRFKNLVTTNQLTEQLSVKSKINIVKSKIMFNKENNAIILKCHLIILFPI